MYAPAGVMLAAIFAAGLAAVASPARAIGPASIASDRCNSRMINDYSGQIRDDEAHPPNGNPSDLQKRFTEIDSILNSLNQERGIMDTICTTDAVKAPLFAEIAATAARALALESDIALRLNRPCPDAAKAFAAAMLAQAWLDLAMVVNDNNGTAPPALTDIVPKIQSRATALGLTLPAFADASVYWRDQQGNKAQQAVEACASPSPSPAPTSSP